MKLYAILTFIALASFGRGQTSYQLTESTPLIRPDSLEAYIERTNNDPYFWQFLVIWSPEGFDDYAVKYGIQIDRIGQSRMIEITLINTGPMFGVGDVMRSLDGVDGLRFYYPDPGKLTVVVEDIEKIGAKFKTICASVKFAFDNIR